MTMQVLRKAMRYGTAGAILAGLLGAGCLAGAAAETKKPAAPAPKPAAKAPAPAKPAGRPAGGAMHGPNTGGAAAHGPTSNGAGGHGPTANGGGMRTTTTGGARTTTTGGMRTTVGGRTGAGPGAGPRGVGGADHNTAFHTSAPRGSNERVTRSGSAIRTRSNGRVSDVHDPRRGMDVHNGLGGGRRVSMERADHSRVFAERGRRGFVQRPYSYHGHDFDRRSYFYHGREYDRFYRGYGYRGLYLNVYAPGFYYRPAFYGWAYNPWAVPIAFGWGWAGNPWYGYYGGYFQPYPVYPSAAFWLTDYIISQDLQAAYAAHQEAGEDDGTRCCRGRAAGAYPRGQADDRRRSEGSVGAGESGGRTERAEPGRGPRFQRNCTPVERWPSACIRRWRQSGRDGFVRAGVRGQRRRYAAVADCAASRMQPRRTWWFCPARAPRSARYP